MQSNDRIVTLSSGIVMIWYMQDRERSKYEVESILNTDEPVSLVTSNLEGSLIATALHNSVHVWLEDVSTKVWQKQFELNSGGRAISIAVCGMQWVACCFGENAIQVWHSDDFFATARVVRQGVLKDPHGLEQPRFYFREVAACPSRGELLAVGSDDRLRVYEVDRCGQCTKKQILHSGCGAIMSISSHEDALLVSGTHRVISWLKYRRGKYEHSHRGHLNHGEYVSCPIAFLNREEAMVGLNSGKVCHLILKGTWTMHDTNGHGQEVTAIAVVNFNCVVSTARDGTIIEWKRGARRGHWNGRVVATDIDGGITHAVAIKAGNERIEVQPHTARVSMEEKAPTTYSVGTVVPTTSGEPQVVVTCGVEESNSVDACVREEEREAAATEKVASSVCDRVSSVHVTKTDACALPGKDKQGEGTYSDPFARVVGECMSQRHMANYIDSFFISGSGEHSEQHSHHRHAPPLRVSRSAASTAAVHTSTCASPPAGGGCDGDVVSDDEEELGRLTSFVSDMVGSMTDAIRSFFIPDLDEQERVGEALSKLEKGMTRLVHLHHAQLEHLRCLSHPFPSSSASSTSTSSSSDRFLSLLSLLLSSPSPSSAAGGDEVGSTSFIAAHGRHAVRSRLSSLPLPSRLAYSDRGSVEEGGLQSEGREEGAGEKEEERQSGEEKHTSKNSKEVEKEEGEAESSTTTLNEASANQEVSSGLAGDEHEIEEEEGEGEGGGEHAEDSDVNVMSVSSTSSKTMDSVHHVVSGGEKVEEEGECGEKEGKQKMREEEEEEEEDASKSANEDENIDNAKLISAMHTSHSSLPPLSPPHLSLSDPSTAEAVSSILTYLIQASSLLSTDLCRYAGTELDSLLRIHGSEAAVSMFDSYLGEQEGMLQSCCTLDSLTHLRDSFMSSPFSSLLRVSLPYTCACAHRYASLHTAIDARLEEWVSLEEEGKKLLSLRDSAVMLDSMTSLSDRYRSACLSSPILDEMCERMDKFISRRSHDLQHLRASSSSSTSSLLPSSSSPSLFDAVPNMKKGDTSGAASSLLLSRSSATETGISNGEVAKGGNTASVSASPLSPPPPLCVLCSPSLSTPTVPPPSAGEGGSMGVGAGEGRTADIRFAPCDCRCVCTSCFSSIRPDLSAQLELAGVAAVMGAPPVCCPVCTSSVSAAIRVRN
uniref:Uncharacterized protein n=1 Tax=Palpitomonas bilix TaxID=652834 RepID=A0A7S3D9S0_9EUKA